MNDHLKAAPVAYDNEPFLNSPDGRILRILAEYQEPLARFRREQIQDTVVFFGSARFQGHKAASEGLAAIGEKNATPAQLQEDLKRAQATLDTATRNLDAARQAMAETVAAEDRARQAYCVTVDGEHTAIVRLRNELANAQFDLDQTTVRAPTGGFVTELALRPGV